MFDLLRENGFCLVVDEFVDGDSEDIVEFFKCLLYCFRNLEENYYKSNDIEFSIYVEGFNVVGVF